MLRSFALLLVIACGGARPPTLAEVAWFAGTWHSPALAAHWQLVGDTFYGIALNAQGGYEVNIIDDSDDEGAPAPISLLALENGRDPMRFTLRSATHGRVELAGPKQEVVRVTKTARGWRGEFSVPGQPPIAFDMEPGVTATATATATVTAPAPELAAADRAFAADTARDGADGWARHFAPDGAMWRRDARVEGAAIHAAIEKTLARGTLTWEPVASGARGDIGFTLGTATFTPKQGGATARLTYATIWKRTPAGWQVLFDIGRSANAAAAR